MDPVSLVGAAVALLKATGLDDWIKHRFHGRPSEAAARVIVDTATAAAGATSWQEAIKAIDGDLQRRDRVRALLIEQEQALIALQYADLADARSLYAVEHGTADRLARQIMARNLIAVILLLGANAAALVFVTDPTSAAALGNVLGASIAYLWNERSQVVGFFFGSSIGSKLKDERAAGRPAGGYP